MWLFYIEIVSVHQKTVEKCKNELITRISVLQIATRLRNDGKIQDKCLGEIKVGMSVCLSVSLSVQKIYNKINPIILNL